MNNIKQEVIWYKNYEGADVIYRSMNQWIADGWRVHTCLNKSSDVIVVYEKEELDK